MPADLVVMGLGFAGLPMAHAAVSVGMDVIGYDTDEQTVAGLNAGRSPVDDLAPADIRRMLAAGFRATADPDVLGGARTVLLCTPAPPAEDGTVDTGPLRRAARTLAGRLRPRTTVILESTAAPGTTEHVIRPLLEASGLRCGTDFHLAAAPTRVDPGNRVHRVANTPKVVGGTTPACTDAAAAFYGRLVERVVRARGPREAEAAKLLENNYRHINIALVNEMAVFCHDSGIDLWDVIRCAETKPYGFQAFRPGPGVGGHCVPLDPVPPPRQEGGREATEIPGTNPDAEYGRRPAFRLVELARQINDRMPRYVVQRASAVLNEDGKAVRGARVLLLGVTYKSDVSDTRNSPAEEIAARLLEMGAEVSFHDPRVQRWAVRGRPVPRAEVLYEAAADADLTLLLQPHSGYDLSGLAVKARRLLDTRGATPAGAAVRL